MAKRDQHVVPSSGGDWAVRRTGAERATRIFDTQKEAVTYARSLAKKERGELYIHAKDGTIRQKDSFGRDPLPPRDKR
jgi:hypothetical protein